MLYVTINIIIIFNYILTLHAPGEIFPTFYIPPPLTFLIPSPLRSSNLNSRTFLRCHETYSNFCTRSSNNYRERNILLLSSSSWSEWVPLLHQLLILSVTRHAMAYPVVPSLVHRRRRVIPQTTTTSTERQNVSHCWARQVAMSCCYSQSPFQVSIFRILILSSLY